ncbi:sialidase-2-like [Saccoglossus kowalevskii]|uniref:Sialidase-4-like n=1 Tax=Saccoglossus kowalevskii TaxID=10224 RepID=A0ABM0H1I0_SACKO|nr:PREDICTED: sialidase-4-like [Saccoglossus kowalevskii]
MNWKTENFNCASYRIPAIVYNKGVFLAFCEARRTSFRDYGEMDLVLRRGILLEKQVEWEGIQVIASMRGERTMNPVPIVDNVNKAVVVVFNTFPSNVTETDLLKEGVFNQTVFVMKSTDNGITWSDPQDITDTTLGKVEPAWTIFSPGPGHGIQLSSGRLIVPGNYYVKDPVEPGIWPQIKTAVLEFFDVLYGAVGTSNVFYSDDGGSSWHVGGSVPTANAGELETGKTIHANESQVTELDDGVICINCRTLGVEMPRVQAFSKDDGMTFTVAQVVDKLVEPGYTGSFMPSTKNFGGCQGSILGFPAPEGVPDGFSKTWALFSNPADKENRINLSVRLSIDGCKTWSAPWSLCPGPSAYSDLTYFEMDDGNGGINKLFACLYECGTTDFPYEKIVFQMFTLESVLEGTKH